MVWERGYYSYMVWERGYYSCMVWEQGYYSWYHAIHITWLSPEKLATILKALQRNEDFITKSCGRPALFTDNMPETK